MIILIPAYEPDRRLVDHVFAAARAAGAEVIRHAPNRGRGYALEAGFAHIAEHHRDHDVVCADGDGQHTLAGTGRVADALTAHDKVVLGARQVLPDGPTVSPMWRDPQRSTTSATGRRGLQRQLTPFHVRA